MAGILFLSLGNGNFVRLMGKGMGREFLVKNGLTTGF